MPLLPGNRPEIVSENVRELVASGRDQKQAVAIALKHAHQSGTRQVKKLANEGEEDIKPLKKRRKRKSDPTIYERELAPATED